MHRMIKILAFTLSSLWRRKYKNCAIIAVFSLVIAVLASILFLTHALKMEAFTALETAPQLIIQNMMGGRHELIPVAYGDKIKTIPGVGQVEPRYWGYYFDSRTQANYTVMGLSGNHQTLNLVAGRLDVGAGECVLGAGVAAVRYSGIGDEMYLEGSDGQSRAYKIVGLFKSEANLLTNDLIILNDQDIQTLFAMAEGLATDLVVEVYNPTETVHVAAKTKKYFPTTRPIMKNELFQTYEALFSWRSGMVLTMFTGALLAFCILAWDKATGISGDERKEIGILKAIGWETADIFVLKTWEGVALSLTSFLTGLVVAYWHVFWANGFFLAPVLQGWSVLFPEFELVPYINMYHILALFSLTVIPYIACTIIPAWKAAITDPDLVMRR